MTAAKNLAVKFLRIPWKFGHGRREISLSPLRHTVRIESLVSAKSNISLDQFIWAHLDEAMRKLNTIIIVLL